MTSQKLKKVALFCKKIILREVGADFDQILLKEKFKSILRQQKDPKKIESFEIRKM